MSFLKNVLSLLQDINIYSITVRILLATLIGACIGLDRGRHGRAAGTRTHILVCLGAAITTMLGFYTASTLGFPNDPLRMGAQVVSGIGFLGVGTIMIRNHSQVTGLTTAAGLWTTACIGLAIGAGFYTVALLSFLAVLLTFMVLPRVEKRLNARHTYSYYIELSDIRNVKTFYNKISTHISSAEIIPAKSGLPGHVGLELVLENSKRYREVYAELEQSEYIVIALPCHM